MNQNMDNNQVNLLDYWHLIRSRIWRILSLAVVITLIVAGIVNAMPHVYRATAVLLLEPEQAKSVTMDDLFNVDTRGSTYFNTQREIMLSHRILEQVIDTLHLDRLPEYGFAEQKEKNSNVFWYRKLLKTGSADRVSAAEQRQVLLETVKDNFNVKPVPGTKLIDISFDSQSAKTAADVANTLAKVYMQNSLESRVEMTRQATSWMRDRADALKQKLSIAESNLQSFIEREGLVNLTQGVEALTSQELTEQTNRAMDARAKVSELSQRYGPRHPKLIAAKNELSQAEQAMQAAKMKILSLGRKGVKLKELKQDVESTRQLYETFLNRLKETDQSGTLKTATARVIDPAIAPLAPIKPKKRLIVTAAFFVALAIGIALVILLDLLDSTIRSVEQVESRLGVALLGLLPLISFKAKNISRHAAMKEMIGSDNHQFVESIRTIRTGIMLSGIDNPHKIILVTSSVPGEGKSTVAATLAVAMGKMEKVLLVDADLRRPTVAKYLSTTIKGNGLTALVAGTSELRECIERSEEFGIDVMPAGISPPNPLELLSSKRFVAVLAALEKHYDRIIIDSTPVQAVSDSLVLCQHVKGVVYVVKADSTPEPLIKTCIKRLKQVDAPLIGIVLNQLDTKKASRYGQYGYGGYYDQYGYSSGSDSEK
ncbi:GumC family protein [Mariprofundus ferrooxydans]|uniref:GumC family protein n=1 Tax=Mariprofundus ferrooxydans TaxID=314344 RepID=UPI0003A73045|nr:polysaccharide biosynthesis tyrosine autokinase [Mariprofundus ferrooxydans]